VFKKQVTKILKETVPNSKRKPRVLNFLPGGGGVLPEKLKIEIEIDGFIYTR